MQIALAGRSALAATRSLRAAGTNLSRLPRVDLPNPSPAPAQRWTRKAFGDSAWSFACNGTLEVAVPEARLRIRTTGISCTVHSENLPPQSYLDAGDGLFVPCPELLFIEMGKHLSPIAQTLLGMELCGTYTRPGAYGLRAVTSTEQIRVYLRSAARISGVHQARSASSRVFDNAWSPMEAIVSAIVSLPLYEMGYGIRRLVLNPRAEDGVLAGRRIPDMLVEGTDVGLNYEGEGHLDLGSIVSAATEATLNPQSGTSQQSLDASVARVREKYVDDMRRDRELWQAGLTVFPITKEDLHQEGAMDSLMLSVYSAIERSSGRDMRRQRDFILDRRFRHERQLRIWSLLPGEIGRAAREELLAEFPRVARYSDYLIDMTGASGDVSLGEGTVQLG